jgi:hypothetical protein
VDRLLIALVALFASVPMAGQITASPSSLTFIMRQGGPLGYPYSGTRDPASQTLTISGTGAWSASRTGALATACGGSHCYTTSPTSGSGAGSVTVTWAGLGAETLAVGTHTGTLTIGNTAVAITVNVQPYRAFDHFAYGAGYPSGCSSATGFNTDPTCTITNERPTSTSFSIPAVGGTYTDPQFGGTVRRVTAAGQNIQYGALSAFSANGTYVMTSDASGNVDVYTVATAAEAYANVSGLNINNCAWDATDENIIWCVGAGVITKRNLSGATTTTAADYTSSSGARPAMSSLSMGGTVDITDDGWWAFRDSSSLSGYVCAVNLNGLTTSTQEAKTFCGATAAYSFTDVDFTQITQVDSETHKRYVVAIAAPASVVWSVGAAGLEYEYLIPSGSSDMTVEPHSDVGQDAQGRQVLFWNWNEINGNKTYLATIQLNKGALMTRPVEEGGGLRLLYHDTPAASTDAHFGCTWRGVCVYTPYGNSAGITATPIQSITAANPCQINSTSHGYSTSNSVQIGGAAGTGVSAMNGIHTVTVLNSNAYTIPVDCSSGWTYTASSAHSALSTASSNSPFRQEIIVNRMGHEARRVAVHRTKTYEGGTLSSYFASPRASISRDGSMVAYASNMGVPESPSVYVAYTGITTATVLSAAVTPADTAAVLNYTIPASGQGAATITISASPALTSPVVSASDGLSALARQYVATGLTADTPYYYRISTTGYSTTGQFRTLPALAGTGRLQLAKGGGGTINYGATSSLGSSCTSPCDLAPSRGLLYHDAAGAAAAVVVR